MKEIISPVDTEDGLFHDGDPLTGTEGTVVSQKWLNPVQDAVISSQQEMASVLKEAGIKIDPSKQDQLLAAIKKITGTATEGYLKVGDYGFGGGPQHKTEAYNTVAQIYRINSSSTSSPGGSVYGVISLPCDGAPSASYLAAGNNGELHVGRSTTPSNGVSWYRVYTTAYKPTAADINAYTKQEADGRFVFKSITVNGKPLSSNVNLTAGDVNAWNKTEADSRFIFKTGGTATNLKITDSITINDNARLYRDGGLFLIEARYDNGEEPSYYSFSPGDGTFRAARGYFDTDIRIGGNGIILYKDNNGFWFNVSGQYFGFQNDGTFKAGKVFEDNVRVYSKNNPQPPNTDWAIVGSYAMAMWGGSNNVSFNEVVSGAGLYPSGAAGSAAGATLPGSWRCMGIATTVNDAYRTTLWLRVS